MPADARAPISQLLIIRHYTIFAANPKTPLLAAIKNCHARRRSHPPPKSVVFSHDALFGSCFLAILVFKTKRYSNKKMSPFVGMIFLKTSRQKDGDDKAVKIIW